ncbi:MAG: EAL domain-containing protein [Deltaproteobacteria bacterium]|jgi:diguanylate cyclase (GGDEF)-like protein|nr:EAL domain-containing protein [Deltaproteobacteria bacterium]
MQSDTQTVAMIPEQTESEILEEILTGEHIKSVYQPIVSLTTGQTYGYEALSRVSNEKLAIDTEHMFYIADIMGKSWELEKLCRIKSLENSINMDSGKKLFINVNSNIFYDESFKKGFVKNQLEKYGLSSDNIIFEITERAAIADSVAFLSSVEHYRNQNYGIAIDDVGSGYSGLNNIAIIRPDVLKIDLLLIRDIDKDETKQLLCKSIVSFGKNANIKTIAEGIETKEELKTVIKLGVDYGQGFFLARPSESFANIAAEKIAMIKRYCARNYNENSRGSVWPAIGRLAKPGHVFHPDVPAKNIYEILMRDHTITEFSIIHNDVAIGFMNRTALHELLGSKYGYSLNAYKPIRQLMRCDFLRTHFSTPSNQVSRVAMQRPFERLYDPIVVEKDDKYFGIVTIKDLLDTCTKTEVNIAMQANPLTGLPGNLLIEQEITRRIHNDAPYCVMYYDIDNFKAYNDAYGFENGDLMLKILADILQSLVNNDDFVGHIGGDDFITICNYHDGDDFCKTVLERFSTEILSLYSDEDVQNGYIVSKNRNGVTETFPIASLSIAGISNRRNVYHKISDFSADIAQLKKKCKRHPGNYFEVI